ncbi:MAG: DUF1846 domain-containing protein [Oscillospiraceae bacterium]|nr:DUF1846 domain-containing protein [Oscillospiraceae bacterium]MBP1571405.1 DUF1846 domain-containing protein [Oscillospiraceae bacterium]
MLKQAFSNDIYIEKQTHEIMQRIKRFDGKLYLEFGGKLFDDFHASRVLPGFKPDTKIKLLQSLADQAEIIFCISADDIEKTKVRADLGISYDMDVLRLIDEFKAMGIEVNSIVINKYNHQKAADNFMRKLDNLGIKSYKHYVIPNYPADVNSIVSDEGYGKNEFVQTTKPLVVVTAPGPGSGKLAVCLSQVYHEHKRGVMAGYAKFETFPIWNLPLKHPVNLAYEAATADLLDVNMIDPFHMEAYNEITVNYNRDVEAFPIVKTILTKITGDENFYRSPTDMGVNMAGYAIVDDEAARYASAQEVIARYYTALCDYKMGKIAHTTVEKLEYIIGQMQLNAAQDRPCVKPALEKAEMSGANSVAYELCDGTIITGRASDIMSATSSATINAIKYLSGIPDDVKLIPAEVLVPMLKLKREVLGSRTSALKLDDVLLALTVSMATNPTVAMALDQLPKLRGADLHSSVMLRTGDISTLKKLGVRVTMEDKFPENSMYF